MYNDVSTISNSRSRDNSKIINTSTNDSKILNKKLTPSELFKGHNDTDHDNDNDDTFETSQKVPDVNDHSRLEVTESPQKTNTFDSKRLKEEPVVFRDKLETLDTNRDQPKDDEYTGHRQEPENEVHMQDAGRDDPNLNTEEQLDTDMQDAEHDELQDAIDDVNNQDE